MAMALPRGAQGAPGIIEKRADARPVADLVDSRTRDISRDGDRIADDRNDDAIAVAQPYLRRRADSEQTVQIDADAAAGADDADTAQRPRSADAAGLGQRGGDVAERGEVILARPFHLAADEHRRRAYRTERDIDFGAQQGPPRGGLDIAGHRADRAPGGRDRRQPRHDDPALAVDPRRLAVVGGALELDHDVVADTDRVARSNRSG